MAWSADVSSLVLGPLTGRPDADWYAAPPGKWCPAQIVHHLALGLEYSGRTFASRRDRPAMQRRPRSALELLAYHLVLSVHWLPPGLTAPPGARPAPRPERNDVERQFREGVDLLRAMAAELLPARATNLFVKHPRLGDLTLPEWLRFHAWHCAHHAKQIRARLS
jgi:hypothetical protein